MRTNVSSDQKAKIVNQYWNGTPVKDLCEKYQVLRSTLYSWLKPYQNVYASQHATEAIATQKEYNNLKRILLFLPPNLSCLPSLHFLE